MSPEIQPESLYKELIEASPDAILYSELSGTIRIANRQAAVMGGFEGPEELIGLNLFEFVDARDRDFMAESFMKLVGGMNKGTIEVVLLRKDGSPYDAEVTGSLIRDSANRPVGLVSITRDITRRKVLERRLVSAKEEADKANRLKDAFISNISHEIRTPLNAILGFTDLIREETEGKLSPAVSDYFPIIDISVQRLVNTVDLIIDLSKLQAGIFVPTKSRFDPDPLIIRQIAEYRQIAAQKSLAIHYGNTAGSIEVYSDPYCLRRTIAALLNNAVKFTQKGSISVSLSKPFAGQIDLKVADTGIGMKPEYLGRIFEPFSQEETGNTRRFSGIGLSLSIIRKLLDAVDARITVLSTPGQGSVFTVSLPL